MRRQAASDRTRAREPYLLGDLTINYAERRVTVAVRPVQLTATEYKLLFELSVNAGRVLTHDQLLRRVGGRTTPTTQGSYAPSSRSFGASWATTRAVPPTSLPSLASATAWQSPGGF